MHSVLVVETDQFSRSATVSALQSAGYQTIQTDCMEAALESANNMVVSAALSDYELPDGSGIELIARLQNSRFNEKLPTIILGPCCNESARIVALQNGADDVISKPVSLNELVLRLNNLLKHSNWSTHPGTNNVKMNGINMDMQSLQVSIEGENADLSLSEFRLLYHFMQNPNKAFTRSELSRLTKGDDSKLDERSIDVYVMRLRKSLQKHKHDHLIQTVRGVGYRFSG